MVLPFPYRLIGCWAREPGPNPLRASEIDEIDGPYMEEVDRRPWMSTCWLRFCPQATLLECVLFWQQENFSPRFLHTGDNETMTSFRRVWFNIRVAHADAFVEMEATHEAGSECLERLLETEDLALCHRLLPRVVKNYYKLLDELENIERAFHRQELVGTYLVLSIAAAWNLALRPGFECSPVDQLAHLSASMGVNVHPEILELAKPLDRERLRTLFVDIKKTLRRAIEASIELCVAINFNGDDDGDGNSWAGCETGADEGAEPDERSLWWE